MFDFMRCDGSTAITLVTIVVICKTDREIGEVSRNARNMFGKYVYCTDLHLRSKGTVWAVTAAQEDKAVKTTNLLLCLCYLPGGNLIRLIDYLC
jgi:archaeosine-15-forming tRNA-guanine transglycosylase